MPRESGLTAFFLRVAFFSDNRNAVFSRNQRCFFAFFPPAGKIRTLIELSFNIFSSIFCLFNQFFYSEIRACFNVILDNFTCRFSTFCTMGLNVIFYYIFQCFSNIFPEFHWMYFDSLVVIHNPFRQQPF